MTELLPELEALPKGLVLDGELVAFNDDGDPHFPLLCRRMLHGDRSVPVRLMIFDVLAIEGEPASHAHALRAPEAARGTCARRVCVLGA